MRQVHRGISVVAAVFLPVFGATGVILQVQRLTGKSEDRHHDAPKALAMVASAYGPGLQHYQRR